MVAADAMEQARQDTTSSGPPGSKEGSLKDETVVCSSVSSEGCERGEREDPEREAPVGMKLPSPGSTKEGDPVDLRVLVLERRVKEMDRILKCIARSLRADAFTPSDGTVPPTREEIVKDGVPGLDLLRKAVLGLGRCRHSSNTKGKYDVVSAQGDGGLGKTTACIVVARDAEVRRQFRDGIYFVYLSESSRDEDVVKQLAHIVKISGGEALSHSMENLSGLGAVECAVDFARDWFIDQKVLIVVDNVWRRFGRGLGEREWVPTLWRIAAKRGSGLLFSTRDDKLSRFAGKFVEFNRLDLGKESEKNVARSMFERHAGVSVPSVVGHLEQSRGSLGVGQGKKDEKYESVVEKVLELSDGWHAVIGAAGSYAKDWKCQRRSWNGLENKLSCRLAQLNNTDGASSLRPVWKNSIESAQDLAAENEGCNELFDLLEVYSMRTIVDTFSSHVPWLAKHVSSLANIKPRGLVGTGDIAATLNITDDEAEDFAGLCTKLGLGKIIDGGETERPGSAKLQLHSHFYEDAPKLCPEA